MVDTSSGPWIRGLCKPAPQEAETSQAAHQAAHHPQAAGATSSGGGDSDGGAKQAVQDVAARTQAVFASEDAADGGAHGGDSGGGTAGNIAKPGEEKEAPASEQPQQQPEQPQNPEEPQPPASPTRSSYWLFQPIYTKVCDPLDIEVLTSDTSAQVSRAVYDRRKCGAQMVLTAVLTFVRATVRLSARECS